MSASYASLGLDEWPRSSATEEQQKAWRDEAHQERAAERRQIRAALATFDQLVGCTVVAVEKVMTGGMHDVCGHVVLTVAEPYAGRPVRRRRVKVEAALWGYEGERNAPRVTKVRS